MAIYTQHSESLPQVLIPSNRNNLKSGMGANGTVGRVMPQVSTERSTVSGKANTSEGGETGFWGKDGFSFGDLLDIINPLQHIPVVSTIYRAITGDEIGIGPRLLGGAVLGGIIGFGIAAINASLEYETGKDAGKHALHAMGLQGDSATAVALVPDTETPQIANLQENGLQALTEEQAAQLLLAQARSTKIANPYIAEASYHASQRYQQIQMLDDLHGRTLIMDEKG